MKRSIFATLLALAAFSESDAMLASRSTSTEFLQSNIVTSYLFPSAQPRVCIYQMKGGWMEMRTPGMPSMKIDRSVYWGKQEAHFCKIPLNCPFTLTADMASDEIKNRLANGLRCNITIQNGYAPFEQ